METYTESYKIYTDDAQKAHVSVYKENGNTRVEFTKDPPYMTLEAELKGHGSKAKVNYISFWNKGKPVATPAQQEIAAAKFALEHAFDQTPKYVPDKRIASEVQTALDVARTGIEDKFGA